MKFRLKNTHCAGNVLLITVILSALMGLILMSYLELIQARTKVRARSMAWNQGIPVAEAGIEEAFTHLNNDSANLANNSWTKAGTNSTVTYQKIRTNSDSSYYVVTISNVASAPFTMPAIYSQSFVPAPLRQGYLSRKVQVVASNQPTIFTKAIAANGLVTLSGGAIVDGYNSSLGPYSSSNLTANGGIATNSKLNPAVKVGTAIVNGMVETGSGGVVTTSGGAVGDITWTTNHTGIEAGYTNDDMNVSFPTNYAPSGSFSAPTVTSTGGSNITYLASGTNEISSFTSSDSTKPLFVTGNAVLIVDGDFTTSGSGYVKVMPGASLILYVGGKATVSGGGVVNGTGFPSNFSLVGTATCTQITYSGSAAFIGTINAPQAALTISGSAGAYGAAICNSYVSSGGSGFHYDTSLGGGGGYKLVSYREL